MSVTECDIEKPFCAASRPSCHRSHEPNAKSEVENNTFNFPVRVCTARFVFTTRPRKGTKAPWTSYQALPRTVFFLTRRTTMGSKIRSLQLVVVVLLLCGAAQARTRTVTPATHSRKLELLNESGERVAVEWISPATGEAFPYWNGQDGEKMFLDSYVNHTFVVRSDSRNATSTFTVTADQPTGTQVLVVKRGLQVERPDPIAAVPPANADASEIVFRCRIAADNALAKGRVPMSRVLDELAQCLEKRTTEVLMVKNEQLSFESQIRKHISHLAENYTCSDPTRDTTKPLRETTWTHRGVSLRVGILHDRPSSQIHVLHNFISREECDAVEQAAKPLLHRGTVADGKGGSRMSENRKGA